MSRYRHEAPIDLRAPLPKEPLGEKPAHTQRPKACNCGDIDCLECWNAGVRYADYLQQKRMEEL